MKNVGFLLVVLSLALFLGGCATILSGDNQRINITTERSEKCNVVVDGQIFAAPAIISLERENRDKVVQVEGCPTEQTLLHKEINPVFFVNILSGGVLGSTTDYASASMWKYQPENVKVDCNPSKK